MVAIITTAAENLVQLFGASMNSGSRARSVGID